MVSRNDPTEDWDALVRKVKSYQESQTRRMIEDCTIGNGALGMITRLSEEWRAKSSAQRAVVMAASRRKRLIETLRWTRCDTELRNYVDYSTKAQLPSKALHRVSHPERRANSVKAGKFFRLMDHRVRVPGSKIPAMIERTYRLSAQSWCALHTYGPAPTRGQINALLRDIHASRPRTLHGASPLAGMSSERARALIFHALSRTA